MAVPANSEAEQDHEFFTHMLDLIPTNFYFDNETRKYIRDDGVNESEEEEEPGNKKKKKKNKKETQNKNDAPPKSTKRPGEELSLKAKWKRAKFDPAQIETVSGMSAELAEKEAQQKQKPQKGAKTQKQQAVVEKQKEGGQPETATDLKEKLRTKIDLLKAKRKALDKRDEFLKRRLKRSEQKAKKKYKQKQEKLQKNANSPLTPKPKAPVPSKPVFNKEGKMVFSKFDFSEKKPAKPEKKSYKKLLENVQKQKEKVEKLKETDKDAAQNLKQKQQWQAVLQKAEGVKVKDNPELIKKAIKKREKKKEKSTKDWKERQEKVDSKMKQRQDKRTANIKKKKDGRINKKISNAKKRGRILPGF